MANKKKEEAETIETVNEAEEAEKEENPLLAELEKAKKESEEYLDKLRRSMAEFDNFKKRTQKEKEATYSLASAETVGAFLPLIDNLERAAVAAKAEGASPEDLAQGMENILKQVADILKDLNVEVIPAQGEPFDPNLHNAVSHIENEELGENTVAAEFQKGYKLGERVIRHSMVQVAN